MEEIQNKSLQTITYLYDILEKAKPEGQKSGQWFPGSV